MCGCGMCCLIVRTCRTWAPHIPAGTDLRRWRTIGRSYWACPTQFLLCGHSVDPWKLRPPFTADSVGTWVDRWKRSLQLSIMLWGKHLPWLTLLSSGKAIACCTERIHSKADLRCDLRHLWRQRGKVIQNVTKEHFSNFMLVEFSAKMSFINNQPLSTNSWKTQDVKDPAQWRSWPGPSVCATEWWLLWLDKSGGLGLPRMEWGPVLVVARKLTDMCMLQNLDRTLVPCRRIEWRGWTGIAPQKSVPEDNETKPRTLTVYRVPVDMLWVIRWTPKSQFLYRWPANQWLSISWHSLEA